MGWSYPSLEGIQATGDPSTYRTVMFEIIRGINERNAAMGGIFSSTGYKKPDGTMSQTITMDDIDGLFMPGASSKLKYNMQTIHSQIGSIASRFTVASGRSATYTATTIRDAVGLPFVPPAAGDKWTDYRWWQGWQDALDLLIYGFQKSPGATASGLRSIGEQRSDRDLSWQHAVFTVGEVTGGQTWWPTVSTDTKNTGFNVLWIMEQPFNYQTKLQRVSECSVTPTVSGVLSEVWMDDGPNNPAMFSYIGYGGDPLVVDYASATDTYTITGTDIGSGTLFEEDFTRQLVNADFPLDGPGEFTLELTNTPPTLSPITGAAGDTGAGWAAFFGDVTYYVDLASILTDQA